MPFSNLVTEYMSQPVHCVRPDTSLAKVQEQLDALGISSLAVTSAGGHLLGVISRTDLIRVGRPGADTERKSLLVLPQRDAGWLMSTKTVHVPPTSTVGAAAELMVASGVHRVFVCEEEVVIGVLSTTDIIRVIAEGDVAVPTARYMSFPVRVVQASDPLSLALERLASSAVDGVVVERGGRLVGVFTNLEALSARHQSPDCLVEECMDTSLVCVADDAPMHEAAGEALEAHAHQVAALRRDGSIGLLTGMDFARAAKREHAGPGRSGVVRRVSSTLVMIMAGGRGARLTPLTCHRAKPAVPFGGRYRIIDFVLSNVVNSGYQRVYVLTQYMASSLIHHISRNWPSSSFGQAVEVVPAQMRRGARWYEGTADSVLQNLNLIRDAHVDSVAVFGGDHIYTFAVDQMERYHRDCDADLTVATYQVAAEEAHHFGVVQIDEHRRIVGFQEKPETNPATIPGQPGRCLVSMGNYFFRSRALEDALLRDSRNDDSHHDFGKDVIPRMVTDGARVFAYDFSTNRIPGEAPDAEPYWRDVGTLDSYFDANMELRSALPDLNLYNRSWPIRSASRNYPPARFVKHGASAASAVVDSLVCEGTILDSASLENVVASYDCFFHHGSRVVDSIILSGCDVGPGCRLTKALLDKNCSVEPGTVIGEDPAADRARFPFITAGGLVVLPKGTHIPKDGPIELSQDMQHLLSNDELASASMDGTHEPPTLSERSRHSFDSVGPRFQRFGGI